MTKVAYLDCPTGLAGDMCLGALIHAGVPLDYLVKQLERLGIAHEYTLRSELVQRNGQQALKLHVDLMAEAPTAQAEAPEPDVDPHYTVAGHRHTHVEEHPHHHAGDHPHAHAHAIATSSTPDPHHARHLPEIEQLIHQAQLPERATAWSLAVFQQLARAEGAVHGIAPEQVHFHEVGATDAIVDVVGTCLGFDWLGVEQIYCSALPTGGGTIWAAHGRLPVPTPAVLKLYEMRQVPVYSNGIERELVTPTGAAIATTLATAFGAAPAMTIERVGLGAGSRELPIPNLVRLWIGEATQPSHSPSHSSHPVSHAIPQVSLHPPNALQAAEPGLEAIAVLETQIDDLNPQAIGYVFEALFAAGALDVFTQAIGMKKSRPGILLTVICPPERIESCEVVLFRETTTLGIRRSVQQRMALHREFQKVQTPYGVVQVKVARQPATGAIANVQPEYEDCAQLAKQANLPWREVHRIALQRWYADQNSTPQG